MGIAKFKLPLYKFTDSNSLSEYDPAGAPPANAGGVAPSRGLDPVVWAKARVAMRSAAVNTTHIRTR